MLERLCFSIYSTSVPMSITTKVSCEFLLCIVLAVVVNRSNWKHRTTVCVRTIWYEMRKPEHTTCPNIPLPSYLIELIDILPSLHHFRMTAILWMQIFGNLSITTPHNLVLQTKQIEAYGIILTCFVIIITNNHVSIIEFHFI